MTYYERVKLFRDNQQRLLDEFLAEVVSQKLLTKTSEVNDENVNKVFLHLRSKNFNRKTVSTWSEHIDKLQRQQTNKEMNEELEVFENLSRNAKMAVKSMMSRKGETK